MDKLHFCGILFHLQAAHPSQVNKILNLEGDLVVFKYRQMTGIWFGCINYHRRWHLQDEPFKACYML